MKQSVVNRMQRNTGKSISYGHIREHIENAEKYLKMAENMIKQELDESMECLVKEMGCIEQEEKGKNQYLEKLEHDLSLHKKTLDQSKSALEKAEKNLALEKETLKKEETNVNSCQKLSIAGGTLLAIPFFFTQIAGEKFNVSNRFHP